ncbi:MAG: copper amine oxidase N-terminal domain-containing protein [Clostridiales bacterium]|jgi:hypothetical protein|nr:copper amine oxidase N-terminal domain-containing protein [Clostridiales bacterium]
MRKKLCIIFLALLVIYAPMPLNAADDAITVIFDGQPIEFVDQTPIIVDGRTLVPARAIFEAFGMEVQWRNDHGQRQIWAAKGDFGISMYIGFNFMSFGTFADYYVTFRGQTMRPFESTQVELDVPPMLVNDRAMVPLRAIVEALDAEVEWNQETRTAVIAV